MARQQLPPQIKKLTVTDRRSKKPVVRYQVTVDAGVNPETGRRAQVRRRYASEREAREALATIGEQVVTEKFVPRKSVTVEEVCSDWIESLHWARSTTVAGYEYNIAPFREKFGNEPIQRINRTHVDALLRELKAGGTTTEKGNVRKPWETRSLNRTWRTVAMVWDYAKSRKLVAHNITDGIKTIPKKRRSKSKGEHDSSPRSVRPAYTESEVRQVLDSVREDRDEHVWFLALSGLRRAELAGLRWASVDLEAKTLDIEIGRASAGGTAVEDDPKTASSVRTLPMDDGMVEVLRRAKRRQAAERLELGEAYSKEGYVACNEDGSPYHPDTVYHRWAKALKKAGVRHVRLHDARHTCGTIMHLRNVPLAVIAAWLGHVDASVTARLYAHSQDEALKEAGATYGAVVTSRDIETG